jgi:hypothetical protein
MNEAMKSGGILGLISIILGVIIYMIDPTLFIKWWFGLSMFALSLGIVSYFGIQYRNAECGGFISFGDAYKHVIVIFVISGAIGALFNLLLFNVIDPELPKILTDAVLDQTYNMMKSFGAPESAIDEQMENLKKEIPNQFSLFGQLKGFGISLIGYAVIALISAAIVKKKQPEAI